MQLVLFDVEPFIDLPDSRAESAFRFGYRCTQTGETLVAVRIPRTMLADAVPLQASAHLTSGGTIITRAEISDLRQGIPHNGYNEVSLAQLVQQVLNVDSLRMDEVGRHELKTLLRELENLVQRVRATLATI